VNDKGTAGVIARPLLLYLAALLLGLALDRIIPWPFAFPGTGGVHRMAVVPMILTASALAASGILNFFRAATPVPTKKPKPVLMTTGIHGWTRNPICLDMFLVYGGIGIGVRSPCVLILTLPLGITIRYGAIIGTGDNSVELAACTAAALNLPHNLPAAVAMSSRRTFWNEMTRLVAHDDRRRRSDSLCGNTVLFPTHA
jgi:hypothetical protein